MMQRLQQAFTAEDQTNVQGSMRKITIGLKGLESSTAAIFTNAILCSTAP
jgi:hypothetical protein